MGYHKTTKKISTYLSNKITRIMFWMSVLVVYIHVYDAQFTDNSFYVANVLQDLFSQGLCRAAVPVFFMISGYLHFSREDLSSRTLLKGMKRKVLTLIIPYFLWNVLYLFFRIGIAILLGTTDEVLNLQYVLKSVFLYESLGAFWYVFQLIMLCAISPLLVKLLKNKYAAMASMGVFFLMYLIIEKNTKWFLLPGLLFFSLGGVCAIHFKKIVDSGEWEDSTKKTVSIVAVIVLVFLMAWRLFLQDLTVNISDLRDTIPYRVFELLIAVAFWYAADVVSIGAYEPREYERCSFFVYAAHGAVLTIANVVIKHVVPVTPVSRIAIYLILPVVVTGCILVISYVLKRYIPGFYKLLSGGR